MLSWPISLAEPPQVIALGRNAHGFEPMDRYCLPDLWSLHLYGYEAKLKIDGVPFDIKPGCIGITPPGHTIETHYNGISVHIYSHFRISTTNEPRQSVPALLQLGEQYDAWYARLYEMNNRVASEPTRVNSRIWDTLWSLVHLANDSTKSQSSHPAVQAAVDIISKQIAEPISIELLAQRVGVSYSYLARLFQAEFGQTVAEFTRLKRLERAVHLLERSTLPVKAIAASVGYPDLQHFNKVMRQAYGQGPRAFRDALPVR